MSRPAVLRAIARADVREISEELEERSVGLGDRFLDRFTQTLERIEFMPEGFGVIRKKVRAARVTKFRHIVYYRILPDRIDVLAVVHGSRDSSVWESRL